MKVLIADDELRLRKVVALYLRKCGYDVIEVSNGAEALSCVEAERPDVIILDVLMPVMTGLEALKELRKKEAFKSTPIVLLTANAGDDDRKHGNESGADKYITKPFSPKELVETIENFTLK